MSNRTLILEDNPETSALIAKFLEVNEPDIRFVMAATGEEAIALFNVAKMSDPFDLLILDVATPQKTGTTVLEELRESGDETTAVLFTALSPEKIEPIARQLRASVAYKPDAILEIANIIRGALAI